MFKAMEFKTILEDPATDDKGKPSPQLQQKKTKNIEAYYREYVLGIPPAQLDDKEVWQKRMAEQVSDLPKPALLDGVEKKREG